MSSRDVNGTKEEREKNISDLFKVLKKASGQKHVKYDVLLRFNHKICLIVICVDVSIAQTFTYFVHWQTDDTVGGAKTSRNFITSQSLWTLGTFWLLRALPSRLHCFFRLKSCYLRGLVLCFSEHKEFKSRKTSCDLWPLYFTIVFFYFLLFIFYISIYAFIYGAFYDVCS